MTLIRDKGKIVFECNECLDTFETHESNFEDALDALRNDSEGCQWTSVKDDGAGEWNHYCGTCSSNA